MKRSFQKQLCLFGSVFVAFSMIFTSFLISAFPVTESKAAPEPTSPVLNEQNAAFESYYTPVPPTGWKATAQSWSFLLFCSPRPATARTSALFPKTVRLPTAKSAVSAEGLTGKANV